MAELRITKEGVLVFDNEDERNVEALQRIIPPDDIYLFALLYMEALETIVGYLGDNYQEAVMDLMDEQYDSITTAYNCCDVLDSVYAD